jgi:hypothetical protein
VTSTTYKQPDSSCKSHNNTFGSANFDGHPIQLQSAGMQPLQPVNGAKGAIQHSVLPPVAELNAAAYRLAWNVPAQQDNNVQCAKCPPISAGQQLSHSSLLLLSTSVRTSMTHNNISVSHVSRERSLQRHPPWNHCVNLNLQKNHRAKTSCEINMFPCSLSDGSTDESSPTTHAGQ